MTHTMKRSLSVLMALVMIISMLSGLTVSVQAADYVANWGYRGATATALSSYANGFYAGNGVSYEDLALLQGSSDLSGVPGSALYLRLQSLMTGNHSHITKYDETKDLYQYTDCQGGTGPISAFYSAAEIGPEWDGTWNREHTWPNSKGLGGSDENDIMMLRPTSTRENSSRGNKAYGTGSGFYNPNTESGGKYNLHGDVARIALYVYTRWGNTGSMWGAEGVIESKELLLNWMLEDPVDTWELGRNDAVQSITGTRNVFVDYPELAFLLFNQAVPANMVTPSGKAMAGYTVTAVSNEDAWGSVSVSGNSIQAVPAEGYQVSGYEVISGTATVIREGNSFLVNAASDCTVQILFAPKTPVTLTYKDNGSVISMETLFSGDTVTLPEYTGTAPQGYTFQGWTTAPVSHSENLPAFHKSGSTLTVSESVTVYALFSYVTTGSGSGIWTLVTDASRLSAGQQVILASREKGLVSAGLEKTYLLKTAAEFADDLTTIPTLPADAQPFTLGGSQGAWTLTNAAGQLLGATAVKKLAFDKGSTTWSITVEDGKATVQNTTQSYGRMLYNVNSPRFTTYTSATNANMLLPQLYVLDESAGVTCYTTETCPHENTRQVAAQAVTCTEDGYTAGVYCEDCTNYISGHELLSAPGHNYNAVVTEPTVTTDGYTTYTCTACGDSYVGDVIPALGETYKVSFSVPVDAAAVEPMYGNNRGIVLPEAEVPAEAAATHTFLGWTTEPVENSLEQPSYYESGEVYVAPSHITLYALYRCVEGGTGETSYVLVESAQQLKVGSKIIIASSEADLALSTTQKENNRGQAQITKNPDKTLTLGTGVAELVLGEGNKANTWSFYCANNSGYLYAASSSKNYLRTKAALDDNGSFSITLGDNGVAEVKAQGSNTRNLLRYNKQSSIFACYGSGQIPVCLYIETMDGSVSYTTRIDHIHRGEYRDAVASTCTQEGTVAHYACGCGMNFADESCTLPLSQITTAVAEHTFTKEDPQESCLKSAANCISPAVYYTSCTGCGASSRDTAWESTFLSGDSNPGVHTGETYLSGQKAPTCTAQGYSGDTHCSGCGEMTEAGHVTPATHVLVKVPGVAPTHTEKGVAEHFRCNVCEKRFADLQASEELTAKDVTLQALGHSYEDYDSDSISHWKQCSCGHISQKGKHSYGNWKTIVASDEKKEGLKERTCKVCGYVQSKTIPASTTPVTGDMAIGLVLTVMIASFCGILTVTAMGKPKGKYQR